jgi:hypothetical protein
MINPEEYSFTPHCTCDKCNWLERVPKEKKMMDLLQAIRLAGFTVQGFLLPEKDDGSSGSINLTITPDKANSVADEIYSRQRADAEAENERIRDAFMKTGQAPGVAPTKKKKQKPH